MSDTTNEGGTKALSAKWVEEVLLDCLYPAEELEAATKDERGAPEGAIIATGIVSVYGFHPDRLASHKDEIIAMLDELPENFKIKPSGGWSFLQACEDRHGNLWAWWGDPDEGAPGVVTGIHLDSVRQGGAFDGPQNRRMINQVTRRTDLRIVGAVLATPDLTGPTNGISVRLLQRHTESSLMPTDYDSAPLPIDIDDNAPDVVDITIIGSQKRYLRTNEGVNELDESLFSRRR